MKIFLNLVSSLKELSYHYERFSEMTNREEKEGLEDLSLNFHEYSEASSQKYLKECLAIRESAFKGIDYFLNSDKESYKKLWDDILNTFQKATNNRNAHSFLKKIINDFEKDFLEHTRKVKKENQEIEEYITEISFQFQERFNKIKEELE